MEGWISTENLIHNLLKVEHRSKFLTKNCTAHLLSSSSFAAFTFFNWLSARLYGRTCLRRKSTNDQNLATEVEINLIKSPATPPSQWEALASCASAKIPWWGIFFKRLLLLEANPDIWLDAIWYGFRQTGCAMCCSPFWRKVCVKASSWFMHSHHLIRRKWLCFTHKRFEWGKPLFCWSLQCRTT